MAILPSLTTFLKLNFKFKKQIPNFRIIYRAYVFPGEIVTVLNVMNFSNFTFNFTETFKLYTCFQTYYYGAEQMKMEEYIDSVQNENHTNNSSIWASNL